nr:laminin G domain-containing protein [uncultured Actinoplanes sp.]
MGKRHFGIVTLAASAVLAGTAGSAAASADHTIAMWDMDEPSRSRVMHDSSDHGLDGRIGREVERTGDYYRFSRLEPDTPPAHPQHLAVVDDDAELDPGSRDYAVTVRLRTRHQFGNIIQKGQATVSGGSFKLQIPNGHVQCWFRGSAGSVLVTAPNKINDGRWHVVHCERTRDGVALRIDGRTVARGWGRTGSVSNSWPVSIGGKTDCDQVEVGCDYFAGDIDYVAIDVDGHAW